MNTYYITTPIYYINDKPHIGHAYATTISDISARYHRMKGEDTFFLTGTDENSLKNVEAAEKSGMGEKISEYLDAQSAIWKQTWKELGMSHDDFIRTTEDRHHIGVTKFIQLVQHNGDIYKGTYVGYYCVGCEEFVRKTDVINGVCPIHKKPLKEISEDNYFFAVSKYRQKLLDHIGLHPDFIQPETKKNEVVNFITHHMEDFSVSRQNSRYGIPFPGDSTHVVYVWFDALINYLTGIGYGANEELFEKFWPAEMHIVGKEIIKFHCAYWPAMLMSAGLPLPKKVFAHGHFTINGEKISKSLGNAIDPLDIAKKYGIDGLRYFLAREIPFGADGDFSFSRLEERYMADLAKGLGNFTSRVATMAAKEYDASTPVAHDSDVVKAIEQAWNDWTAAMEGYSPEHALNALWNLISFGDKYIEHQKPWALSKDDQKRYTIVIRSLVEVLRHISVMVSPFMPVTAEKIWSQLGIAEAQRTLSIEQSRALDAVEIKRITKGASLFPPFDENAMKHRA